MEIGEPVRTVIVEPLVIPIPQRAPVETPQAEPTPVVEAPVAVPA